MAVTPGSRQDQATDYYHSFRFGVLDSQSIIQGSLAAGFSNVTLPEQNIEHLEYSEGTWTYSRMYPGRSTFSSVTLSRGVVKGFTAFYDWVRKLLRVQIIGLTSRFFSFTARILMGNLLDLSLWLHSLPPPERLFFITVFRFGFVLAMILTLLQAIFRFRKLKCSLSILECFNPQIRGLRLLLLEGLLWLVPLS